MGAHRPGGSLGNGGNAPHILSQNPHQLRPDQTVEAFGDTFGRCMKGGDDRKASAQSAEGHCGHEGLVHVKKIKV